MDEKVMNINLKKTKAAPRSKKAKRAINEIRQHVVRHMKADEDKVWIDHRLNEAIWANGIHRPPTRITKAVKFETAWSRSPAAGFRCRRVIAVLA